MDKPKITYDNIYSVSERKTLIADSLKTFRALSGLKQREVAEAVGVTQQTYATYERGRNEPPAEMLVRLSFLYDIPIDLLVQRDNMDKDAKSFNKQLDEFNAVIDEARKKVLSGDPEMREQLKQFTDGISKLTEAIRGVGIDNKDTTSK